jgi:hypothetical protein
MSTKLLLILSEDRKKEERRIRKLKGLKLHFHFNKAAAVNTAAFLLCIQESCQYFSKVLLVFNFVACCTYSLTNFLRRNFFLFLLLSFVAMCSETAIEGVCNTVVIGSLGLTVF